jgi:membrane associated rhomboid family serine protease
MITILIIIVTCLISFLCFSNETLFKKLAFNPTEINIKNSGYFKFVSHGFVHADFGHLFFNMLTFIFFWYNN